jgi:hypothetical protein
LVGKIDWVNEGVPQHSADARTTHVAPSREWRG